MKTYYLFIFIAVPIGTILGTLLIFQYRPDLSELNQESKVQDSENSPQNCSEENNEEGIPVSPEGDSKEAPILPKDSVPPEEPINEQNKQQLKKVMKKIIKHKRIWILSGINFLASFLFMLVVNTFKTIGATAPTRVDAELLKYTATLCGLSLSFFGPIWGFLIDKIDFKIIFIIVNGAGIGIGVGLVFGLYIPWLFCLMVCLAGLGTSGVIAIFTPHVMKVYGIQYSMMVSGIINFIGGLSNLFGSIFAFIFSSVYPQNQNFAYGCVYVIGSAMNLVALILTFFESNKPFMYDDTKEEIDNVEKICERESKVSTSPSN